MHTWTRRVVAGALGLATTMAAVAPAGASDPRPTGSTDVVLRVSTGGGYVPEQVRLSDVPELTVYGDGRMVVLGPTTLEYPGPALPNLRELRLTPEGIDRVVRLATAAGLLSGKEPDYGSPQVTDNPTTAVTVNARGKEVQVSAYALGFDDASLTDTQARNRERLQRLIARAERPPRRFVLEGSRRRFVPTAIDVHTLATGECHTVAGADAAALLASSRDQRADDGTVLVPLLPDQRGCTDEVVVRIRVGRNGWGAEDASFRYEEMVVHADGVIAADGTFRQIDDAALTRILEAADEAGLTGVAPDYGEPGITDQGTVVVEVTAPDGTVHRAAAYALGMEDVDENHLGLTDAQVRAREELAGFVDLVSDLAAG